MNVYFGAAITRYRKLLPVYRSVVSIIEDLGHEVLSKHVVDPKLTLYYISQYVNVFDMH